MDTRSGADEIPTEPERRSIRILRYSDNFLVIEKPYDMLINSDDPDKRTLQTEMTSLFPNLANKKLRHEFHFVHRLDFATSGVMRVALDERSAGEASRAFARRSVGKYYPALLRGHVGPESVVIDKPARTGGRTRAVDEKEAREKPRERRTALPVLERGWRNERPVTEVLARPETGRRHRSRVHRRRIGHTVVGDYSDGRDGEPRGTFLRSYGLVMENPSESIDETTLDPFSSAANPPDDRTTVESDETVGGARRRVFARIDESPSRTTLPGARGD